MNFKNLCLWVLVFFMTVNVAVSAPIKKEELLHKKRISDINLCLEKNEYRNADRLIYDAINARPGDVQIQLLSVLSLTMQNKLDSAQDLLNTLTKSAQKYPDYYYAQGAIYLKRIGTSDMEYRTKRDEYLSKTVNLFNYSLKLNPNNARVYCALGVAELKRDDLFKAKKCFEKAIELNPNYSTAYDNLGSIYYITNELDKAQKYYKKAEVLNPTSATVYYHLAQLAFKNNDVQNSLYYVNKSLLWNKQSPYAHNLLGEIYKKQGNEAAAITSFKRSIFIMPEYITPYLNLAKIYEGRGDIEAAVEQLKTAYSIDSSDDIIKLNLADLIYASGQYEDALRYYSQLSDKYKLESVEGLASCYYALATETANKTMFKSNRHLTDALHYIDQAIKATPDNLELYLTKSKLSRLINNQAESKEVLLKIVSAPNTNVTDVLAKAEAYLNLQQYRDARNMYTLAVKIDKPIESDLYLAEYFTSCKQYMHAKNTLDNILSKSPNNYDALNNLAYIDKMLSYSDSQYKNAVYLNKHDDKFFSKVYLNKSLKYNPNNINANLMLGKILKKEKDYYGSNRCYKVALGAMDDEKQIKKTAKVSKKIDKKIAKIEAKKAKKELKTAEKNVLPIKNSSKEKDTIPAVNVEIVK